MTELDDHELLRQYAESESEAAFATLVERYINLVYSAALRFTGNPHHAEEVTQAAFIILARKAGSLGRGVVLPGWIYQTARLTAANFMKREIRRQRREAEYLQSTPTESEAKDWDHIAPLLEEAMGQLGEADRNAVVLRYFERRTAQEVAAMLHMNERAAQKRLNRAVDKLRKFFVKRGVVTTAALLTGMVSTHSVEAAPMALSASITTTAMTHGVVAGGSTLPLVKGTLKMMAWAKAKFAVATTTVLLVVGTGAVMQIDFISRTEPSYQGKRLSEWLPDVDYTQRKEKRAAASEAIRQMGTRVIPFLLADLSHKDAASRKVHYLKPDPRTADERSRQATWAFDALGPLGKSAIPELTNLLEQNPGYVTGALAGIGRDALPTLLQALTNRSFWVRDNTAADLANAIFRGKILPLEAKAALPIAIRNLKDENVNTRHRAGSLLAALHLQPEISVPALAEALSDTNMNVAENCAQALGGFGQNATSAVPALIAAIGSTNGQLSATAASALSHIDPQAVAEEVLPKLLELLHGPDAVVRMQAIQSLGNLGEKAAAAIPELIGALNDDNEVVRMVGAQSLGSIGRDPGKAVTALSGMLNDSSRPVRMASINALGQFGKSAQSAIPDLLGAAKSDPELKNNVSAALSRIDPQRANPKR